MPTTQEFNSLPNGNASPKDQDAGELRNQDTHCSLARGLAIWMTTSSSKLMGVIQDCMPNAISVLVSQPLAEGSRIAIESGSLVLEGEVTCCGPNGDRYEACIVVSVCNGIEQRSAQRFPLNYEARIYRTNSESEIEGSIVDLSATGVGLEVTTSLDVGEILTFESESEVAFAIVRYCRRAPEGQFHAGLELFHSMPKEPEASHHPRTGSLLGKLWSVS
jgi:hypothetical protein